MSLAHSCSSTPRVATSGRASHARAPTAATPMQAWASWRTKWCYDVGWKFVCFSKMMSSAMPRCGVVSLPLPLGLLLPAPCCSGRSVWAPRCSRSSVELSCLVVPVTCCGIVSFDTGGRLSSWPPHAWGSSGDKMLVFVLVFAVCSCLFQFLVFMHLYHVAFMYFEPCLHSQASGELLGPRGALITFILAVTKRAEAAPTLEGVDFGAKNVISAKKAPLRSA